MHNDNYYKQAEKNLDAAFRRQTISDRIVGAAFILGIVFIGFVLFANFY